MVELHVKRNRDASVRVFLPDSCFLLLDAEQTPVQWSPDMPTPLGPEEVLRIT